MAFVIAAVLLAVAISSLLIYRSRPWRSHNLSYGKECLIKLDDVKVYISPDWKKDNPSLLLDGCIEYRDSPDHPLDRLFAAQPIKRTGLSFVSMHPGQKREIHWIKSVRGRRHYPYLLTVNLVSPEKIGPESSLSICLERI